MGKIFKSRTRWSRVDLVARSLVKSDINAPFSFNLFQSRFNYNRRFRLSVFWTISKPNSAGSQVDICVQTVACKEMDEFETIGDDLSGTVEELLSGEPTVMKPSLNLDVATWEGWFNSIVIYAAQNPWDFLYYVMLGLSPFFLISVILSMKLARALEAQEKETKRKAKRDANLSKARRAKAD